MYKIVEFLDERGKYRLFGIQNWYYKISTGEYVPEDYIGRTGCTFTMSRHVRKHCMFRAKDCLKVLKSHNEEEHNDSDISTNVVTVELLAEVAESERWWKFWK